MTKPRKDQLYNAIIYVIGREPICVSGIIAGDWDSAVERALELEGVRFEDTCAVDIIDMAVGI